MERFIDTLANLQWGLITGLSGTGIIMGLISCLVGMRQKVEIPLWWGLYAIWIAIMLFTNASAPFLTILIASGLAGILHGMTQAFLVDHYKENNPWYAEKMQGPKGKMATQFVVMGIVIGIVFGAIVGGIAWGLSLL